MNEQDKAQKRSPTGVYKDVHDQGEHFATQYCDVQRKRDIKKQQK